MDNVGEEVGLNIVQGTLGEWQATRMVKLKKGS